MQNWKKRYYAKSIASASLAANNHARGLVNSNQTGVTQLYAWDVASGDLTQLTHDESGKGGGTIDPSGQWVFLLEDDGGDEMGQLVRIPWQGGEPIQMTPDFEPYGITGLNVSGNGKHLGFLGYRRDGFRLYFGDLNEDGSLSNLRELWHSTANSNSVDISWDGSIVVIKRAYQAGKNLMGLIAIDTATGEEIATRHVDGVTHHAYSFIQQAGSFDLVGTSTESGFHRPYIWLSLIHI